MVLIVLVIPFDFLFSLPGMCTKRIKLKAPGMLDYSADGKITITTYQKRPFPSGRIKARMRIVRDDAVSFRRLFCNAEDGSLYDVSIDTLHCGLTVFEIMRIRTTSVIGLFTISFAVEQSVAVLILPAPIKPPHVVSLPRGVVLRPKPGGGFSEDSDLRPYRAGDPIRIIHWKLSAKFDSLIIREPLSPPPHSRLVHIMKWDGVRERDLILGRFRWISNYLLKWELPYFVRLGNDGLAAEITCEKEFMDFLCKMLGYTGHIVPKSRGKAAKRKRSALLAQTSLKDNPADRDTAQVPARCSWVFRIDAKEEKQK